MTPLTITPVGAIGESDPALAPLPTMMAIKNAEIPTCPRRPSPWAPRAPSPRYCQADRGQDECQDEEHHRHHADAAPTISYGSMRDTDERAVRLRLREEERDADEREEQPRGEAGHHLVGAEPSHVDADHQARAIARNPTWILVVQLTTIAINNAPNEIAATSIGWSLPRTREERRVYRIEYFLRWLDECLGRWRVRSQRTKKLANRALERRFAKGHRAWRSSVAQNCISQLRWLD